MKKSSTSLALFAVVAVTLSAVVAVADDQINLPQNVTIPAAFGFGDSIIDPGNNNFIPTFFKSDFYPYGKDFAGRVATGRYSNGKIPTDFIVEELGIKSYLPAFLDPQLNQEEYLTGVSFASGGSGYDPLTSTITFVISMKEQLTMFKQYIGKVKAMVGDEKADFIIKNSLYVVVAGSNDIGNTYFITPFQRFTYDFNAYTNLMLDSSSSFIQELYGLGARRIAVFSVPPVGCVPLQRTLGGGLLRACADEPNQVAQMFNSKLSAKLPSLESQLPDSRLVYFDVYNPLLDIIKFPSKYGIDEVDKGCCGTGIIELSLLCNGLSPLCKDVQSRLFWDSYHPTERAYQILSQEVLPKYISSFF